MIYGEELVRKLEKEIETLQGALDRRAKRIENWETDEDDCFLSQRVEERGVRLAKDKIKLIRDGGTAWFAEYATAEGILVRTRWCDTKFGHSLRAEMPDGSVVWTTATTSKGLQKKGLKKVLCKRPAWYCYDTPYKGMMGAYCGSYELFPSDFNYATGEEATVEPIEMKEIAE